MKDLTHYFNNKNILFKNIESIEPKILGSRKKIEIYCATGIDKNYYAIFILNAKSIFEKERRRDVAVSEQISESQDHNFKKGLVDFFTCMFKAKAYLKENGWSVYSDFM